MTLGASEFARRRVDEREGEEGKVGNVTRVDIIPRLKIAAPIGGGKQNELFGRNAGGAMYSSLSVPQPFRVAIDHPECCYIRQGEVVPKVFFVRSWH